jgi:hypothetical protein
MCASIFQRISEIPVGAEAFVQMYSIIQASHGLQKQLISVQDE